MRAAYREFGIICTWLNVDATGWACSGPLASVEHDAVLEQEVGPIIDRDALAKVVV